MSFARRIGVLFALAAALYGERPHWDRVQHFVFVLLPRASFDQYFGAYPDSEGRPGGLGPREIPNLWAYADLYTLQDHFFASAGAADLLRGPMARVGGREYTGDLQSFLDDCRRETLPPVSLLAPDSLGGETEMGYVTNVVNAVAGSRLWRRAAVFVAWAEPGDFGDHVRPPGGMGGRVPSLVISPWARLAYNDHRVYTHQSWARNVEERFGLAHDSDGVADLYDAFDFAQQPREPVLLDITGAKGYPVEGQGQVFPASGWLDSVHRAHGTWTVAAGSMVIGYGAGFAGAAEVVVTDSAGVGRRAAVQYVGTSQVNYVVPDGTAAGLAQVRITTAGQRYDGFLIVERVSPGLFTATQMGQGPADGEAEGESTFGCEETRCWAVAVKGRRVSLRGTGIRGAAVVRAWVDGVEARVVGFGADAEVEGLDRVEVELAEGMAGLVLVMVEADGVFSNSAQLLLGGGL